jgi:low temperature requirement protein LtrA
MKITHSLVSANSLILSGILMSTTIVGAQFSLTDGWDHWLPNSARLGFAAPALTLIGSAWSGWLVMRESPSHGFWSRALLNVGIVLCCAEWFVILWGVLGIGVA